MTGGMVPTLIFATVACTLYGILIWQMVENEDTKAKIHPARIEIPCLTTGGSKVSFEDCGFNGTQLTEVVEVYIPHTETTSMLPAVSTPCGPADIQQHVASTKPPPEWTSCFIDPLTSDVFLYPSDGHTRDDTGVILTSLLGAVAIYVAVLVQLELWNADSPTASEACVKLLSATIRAKIADLEDDTKARLFSVTCGSNPGYAELLLNRAWDKIADEPGSAYHDTILYQTCDGNTIYATVITCDGTYPIDEVECFPDYTPTPKEIKKTSHV